MANDTQMTEKNDMACQSYAEWPELGEWRRHRIARTRGRSSGWTGDVLRSIRRRSNAPWFPNADFLDKFVDTDSMVIR